MASIELNRGIERILPHVDPQKTIGLPTSTHLSPEGERITNYVETHFSQLSVVDDLLEFVRPNLDMNVTAPLHYLKHFRATLDRWRRRRESHSVESGTEATLDNATGVLEQVEADMQLLSDYILCLQKV